MLLDMDEPDLKVLFDPERKVASCHDGSGGHLDVFMLSNGVLVELYDGCNLIQKAHIGKKEITAGEVMRALSERSLKAIVKI